MEQWADQIREEGTAVDVRSIIRSHRAAVAWPDWKPPFVGRLTLVDETGHLWLSRTPQDGRTTPVYDLIDQSGVPVRRVVLPTGTHLLGFGNGAIYLARVDEVGLQWLERYRFE